MKKFQSPRVNTRNTHGTGCTLSSAIASFLAMGCELEDAIYKGKEFVTNALIGAKDEFIGKGHGPLNHFFIQ